MPTFSAAAAASAVWTNSLSLVLASLTWTWTLASFIVATILFPLFPIATGSALSWRVLARSELRFRGHELRDWDAPPFACDWPTCKKAVFSTATLRALLFQLIVQWPVALAIFIWQWVLIGVGFGLTLWVIVVWRCHENSGWEKSVCESQGVPHRYEWIWTEYYGSAVTVPVGLFVLYFGVWSSFHLARAAAAISRAALSPSIKEAPESEALMSMTRTEFV